MRTFFNHKTGLGLLALVAGITIFYVSTSKPRSTLSADAPAPSPIQTRQPNTRASDPAHANYGSRQTEDSTPEADVDARSALVANDAIKQKFLRGREWAKNRGATAETWAPDSLAPLAELLLVKAVPSAQYSAQMGSKVGQQGDYILFRTAVAESALEVFDGSRLPVVTKDGKVQSGVVSGDISVTFHAYPGDLARFAADFDLRVVSEKAHTQRAYLAPLRLPVNLLEVLARLRASPAVREAEITVVFGGRRPK